MAIDGWSFSDLHFWATERVFVLLENNLFILHDP